MKITNDDKKVIKQFIKTKYPSSVHVLNLDLCFDYYVGICTNLGKNIKEKNSFYLLSSNEKIIIEDYIEINKYKECGKEMSEYYSLLLNIIDILKKYLLQKEPEEYNQIEHVVFEGIQFTIPNEFRAILYDIFNNIEFKNCTWNVINVEAYLENGNVFLENKKYHSKEFKNIIKEKCYVVSLKLQIENCFQDTKEEAKKYSDLYELICTIEDSNKAKILCKDKPILDLIYQNALISQCENIEYITNK